MLTTLPKSIGGLVGLKTMNLSECSTWENLEIPMDLGRLISLEELYVPWSGNKSVCLLNVGEFKKLKKLVVEGNVPAGFDRLNALTHLHVRYVEDASTRLSSSLGAFTALQSLHKESVKLSCIPQSLGKLKSLRWVVIQYCTKLSCIDALPQCLEHLVVVV